MSAKEVLKQKFFNRKNIQHLFYEIGTLLAGSALYASSLTVFLLPSHTVMGGIAGIATTLNILYGTDVGMVILALNVPLVLCALKMFGFRFLSKTIITIIISSAATDLLTFLPVTLNDPLLCALMGGAVMGVGTGVMMTRGYNTGGSDLAGVMLSHKYKRFSTGRMILIIDFFIIVGSAIALHNYTAILYSLIAASSYSFALDLVLDGSRTAKLTLIISDKYDVISDAIFRELDRGVTILNGIGWYSRMNKNVIMCVIKRQELYILKNIVKKADPSAFMILSDAREVMGYGFSELS